MQFPTLQDQDGHFLDQVQLTGMLMSCVIGIFPSERNRKQPVTIDLCLYLNTRKAAKSTNIHDTVDYAAAVEEVTFILEQCEFLLIETAVEAVCQYFLSTYTVANQLPQVDAVMVRISKPSALTHGVIPSIQIARRRSASLDESIASRSIHQSDHGSLTLMQIPAGAELFVTGGSGEIKAALTLGRWQADGQALKPRTTLVPRQVPIKLSHTQASPQLVLLYH